MSEPKARDQLLTLAREVDAYVDHLEAVVAARDRALLDETAERKVWQRAAEKYEPDTCKGPGCMKPLPTAATLDVLEGVGVRARELIGTARLMVMGLGFCSSRCMEAEAADNVIPMEGHR